MIGRVNRYNPNRHTGYTYLNDNTVAKYKEHIPDYIYNRFLTVEVKPY